MILNLKQIILLKYLTKYNIKIIKDYANLYEDFDTLLFSLIQNFLISDKVVNESYVFSEIAIDKLKYYDIQTITCFDDDYPIQLKRINDSPLVIYYKGVLKLDKLAAVVGSRKVSKHGKKITYQIVDWLNELNFGVVSGLALGIDTFAHEKAVQNKQYTIAVLPNSLDSIYPPTNFKLANEIIESGGCLVSEMIFGINRGNQSFVQRNRIQAALSDTVIPIEMGVNSGTMHTIDFAKRYKKNIALFKPTPMLSEIENYFGILHLINNPHQFQSIFTDRDSFFNLINSLGTTEQFDLGI
ncbi:DNA-processing protein DprA [Flavobacterium terrigena]|uniref:DNA protecting protein DprA n=1 Tax=Flavobacterium terrigena TaxID=402734 RepID=A0A1H6UU44_9FLAO|nr:DNA-processing protein DprA [Flavobacterium terrigena]SEI93207.1 DNA protecting protein DprA [Flavobacterium terrigena]